MDLFTIVLPTGTEIYRGFSDLNKTDGNWFAYTLEDAKAYGKVIKKYKLLKDVKLINVLSGFFHIDYMDKVNLKFTGHNLTGIHPDKAYALFPLGLPDINTQKSIAKVGFGLDCCNDEIPLTPIASMSWSSMYNISRYSIYQCDVFFFNLMNEFYASKCDGFTLPLNLPNRYKAELNHREIALFDTSIMELIETINLDNGLSGGARDILPKDISDALEQVNKDMKAGIKNPESLEYLASVTYKGYSGGKHAPNKTRKRRR
jgi:hypothetical protein